MGKSCGIIGYRDVYCTEHISSEIHLTARKLVTEDKVTEFWVGIIGAFGPGCRNAIKKLKECFPFIHINLVAPKYMIDIDIRKMVFENYDNVCLLSDLKGKNDNIIFDICNEYIAENSSFLICFTDKSYTADNYPNIERVYEIKE